MNGAVLMLDDNGVFQDTGETARLIKLSAAYILSDTIERWRKEHHVSQADLARAAGIGRNYVSRLTVAAQENTPGIIWPSRLLAAIAAHPNVTATVHNAIVRYLAQLGQEHPKRNHRIPPAKGEDL